MDSKALGKRLNTIEGRIEELSAPEGYPQGFDVDTYLGSQYYEDGLAGLHPFVDPASTQSEYITRRDYFGETRLPIVEEYSSIINMADSDGQRWYEPFKLKIGIIADEFLYKSFVNTAHFVPLTPKNYLDYVGDLDLVLVTSTWRGLNGEWFGASQKSSAIRKLIENDLIPSFQASGTPVAFYSKEDPPNYSVYISTAQKCDFIFTSAVEMVDRYQEDCLDVKSIGVLPFSVDYAHHNPVGSRKHRINDVVFAGSWHNHKYPERRLAAANIFDGVINSNRKLRIIDRNWDLDISRYQFPQHYLPYVEASVAHDDLLRIHRTSDIVINLNSVISSSSMYANRVVELQAMGCTVLSNYNAGVNDQFPNVFMPESSFDTADIIESLDGESLYRNQMAGLRNVYANHVNFDRMRILLTACGLVAKKAEPRRIAILGERNFAEKFSSDQVLEGSTADSCLEVVSSFEEAREKEMDLVCTVSEVHEYSQNYLQDLINATKYVAADEIFKAEPGARTDEHLDFTDEVVPKHGSLRWLSASVEQPSKSKFMLDGFGVKESPREVVSVVPHTEPKLTVIVPVYNNGHHLEFKCFESLRRSSIFEAMEILLIDDGSTDKFTRNTVLDLERRFDNVKSYLFEIGGSGSASRPRNKGLQLASADWLTYLDPDNEALSDGYAKLLKLGQENNSNFAIGNMVRNADRRKLVNNVRNLRSRIHQNKVAEETYEIDETLLSKINFSPMSIQALVADTVWLRSTGIEQPLGAVGQDSFFFQQMLYYSDKISLLNEPIHAYFAAVSNSTVNSLGPNFYKKYLPLESARAKWLEEVGLLDEYKAKRMEPFAKWWYLEKLKRVEPEGVDESVATIHQLVDFYGEHEWVDEELKEFFGTSMDIAES